MDTCICMAESLAPETITTLLLGHCCLVAKSCLTLYDPRDCRLPGSSPWDSPGKNTEMGCHILLQGIFLTQGSNLSLLQLLNWQADFLLLSHRESLINCHVK